ncbi:MAG: hypothetical protein WKF73_12340 [Nocardioidaceae bacterium]
MPAVTLVGSHLKWPAVDKARYDGGRRSASPRTALSSTRLRRSANQTRSSSTMPAAEQYVAESWSITVDRNQHKDAHAALLQALRPGLSGMFYERMRQATADLRARLDTQLVVPLRRPKMAEAINEALGLLPSDPALGGHGTPPDRDWRPVLCMWHGVKS